MKALTVQQPWAWAIIRGGKDVENRTTLWRHRGPLAIHAGKRLSERGVTSPLIVDAWERRALQAPERLFTDLTMGAIIGIVNVVDIHLEFGGCCESEWAETSYVQHDGSVRREIAHLVLDMPIEFEHPIPCKGALGLWTVPADVEARFAA